MNTEKLDLLITGVGGQGVVLASDIIGETALAAGFDVKKTDTLGMAQRGGGVVSHVRIGQKVWSPIIRDGEVDLMMAFEMLEGSRWSHFIRPGGVAIINEYTQPPLSVGLGQEAYPDKDAIKASLERVTDKVYFIDANARARELGNERTSNIFMLGCFSVFAPIEADAWREAIRQRLPEKLHEINLRAFDMGRKELEGVGIG